LLAKHCSAHQAYEQNVDPFLFLSLPAVSNHMVERALLYGSGKDTWLIRKLIGAECHNFDFNVDEF